MNKGAIMATTRRTARAGQPIDNQGFPARTSSGTKRTGTRFAARHATAQAQTCIVLQHLRERIMGGTLLCVKGSVSRLWYSIMIYLQKVEVCKGGSL